MKQQREINLNVNVIEVKYPPAIGKIEMMSGIRTKEAAAFWASKRKYQTVYWLRSRERVYAEKKAVNPLFAPSENGSGLIELLILLALGLIITYCLWLVLW